MLTALSWLAKLSGVLHCALLASLKTKAPSYTEESTNSRLVTDDLDVIAVGIKHKGAVRGDREEFWAERKIVQAAPPEMEDKPETQGRSPTTTPLSLVHG